MEDVPKDSLDKIASAERIAELTRRDATVLRFVNSALRRSMAAAEAASALELSVLDWSAHRFRPDERPSSGAIVQVPDLNESQ